VVARTNAIAATVAGDRERLQQIVGNLLSNAVKFTPGGGLVEAEIVTSPSTVTLRVTDSGQGIDPEFLPHVFDRFRQADGTPTREHGGLGIGLSIVRELVELHGGSVEAFSGGRGRGSTFTVTFPLAVENRVGASKG
jgi:signal transduction histidine kinase